MKKIFFLLFMLFTTRVIRAQAVESSVEYHNTSQPAAMIEFPSSPSIVLEAFRDYMTKKGSKLISSNSFLVAKGIRLDPDDQDLSDLYFRFEPKSRQDKRTTLVFVVPTGPNQALASDSLHAPKSMSSAKSFLNTMIPFVQSYQLKLQTQDQEALLKRVQQKMSRLQGDQADLEKRIRNLTADLDQDKKDQARQTVILQNNFAGDEATLKKAQKKMNHLLDDQGNLEKKLRKSQASLDQNNHDQLNQSQEMDKQKQALESIKAKE